MASDSIWLVGSDPIDNKHTRGILVSLSAQVASRFKMTDSAYLGPCESAMNFLACGMVLSGHQDLHNTKDFYSPPQFIRCYQYYQSCKVKR